MDNKNMQYNKRFITKLYRWIITKETEEFVKKHLEECDSCKKIYNNMKNLNLKEETKSNKKIIDFTKKFRRKLIFKNYSYINLIFFHNIFYKKRNYYN